MNENTLVSVHGYAGDSHQIRNGLPFYEHHRAPVVIFSPDDSRITKMGPHICVFGGKRAYTGPLSLERQMIHLKMLLEYPFDFFLMNDSDSFCLSPEIPKYLYDEPEVLWSNEVSDMMHQRKPEYTWPRLAFQPPYFASRKVLERLIEIAPTVECEPQTPFIDWCMMAWAIASECPHKNFRDGASYPTFNYPPGQDVMRRVVRNEGKIMVHSIKDARTLHALAQDHIAWARRQGRNVANVGKPRISVNRARLRRTL